MIENEHLESLKKFLLTKKRVANIRNIDYGITLENSEIYKDKIFSETGWYLIFKADGTSYCSNLSNWSTKIVKMSFTKWSEVLRALKD